MKQKTSFWLEKLSGSVPVAPVHDVGQALDNPFVAERGSIRDYRYPDGRAARMVASPIRVSSTELPQRAAPALGADTDALLKEIGYDAARIARLREAIDRSREMYEKRVEPQVAARFDYFHYELLNDLAGGDAAKLGSSYPGAAV